MSESRKELLGRLHETGVLGIAMLEHIEIKRTVVNAGTEQHHVRLRIRGLDEVAHFGGAQIGFQLELRRQESVKRILIQVFSEQELSDRPIFVPVGTLIGRVVQNTEAGIEFLPRGVVV